MSLVGEHFIWVTLIFFVIAFLYASVGFGGGSSYLAILALVAGSFFIIRSTALLCNLIVVGGSCLVFLRGGHFKIKKFLPFVITSVPMAFIGASFRLTQKTFFILLGTVLILAAFAMIVQSLKLGNSTLKKKYAPSIPYFLGGGIGFLSGLVGIGGGIFLAPLLNQLQWDRPKTIAALASFFILVNSVSGLAGLLVAGTFELLWPKTLWLLFAVLLGGQLGIRFGIKRISPMGIRIVTALLVLFVGIRVLVSNALQLTLFT